jgi:Peptidase family S41
MSEHPLIKHSLKSSKIIKDPTKSWWSKLKGIFIEILIIVFAISATLYMERWRENQHDWHLEKEFLSDLKSGITIKIFPLLPRLKMKVALLTGGGAISLAENFVQLFEYYQLAEIIGEPTAGTTGGVNICYLLGGLQTP